MINLRLLNLMFIAGLGGMFIGQWPVSAQDTPATAPAAIAQVNPASTPSAIDQEGPSDITVSVEPIEYAAVKGNVDKFRALNWMKDGANGGVTDVSFKKEINKDTSLEFEGRGFFKTEDNDGHLVLQKGDLGFLKIDYKSFRAYYDNTGGVYRDNGFPASLSGTKAGNSPDLQMDISYFKLETGLGEINDPFLDVTYEHNAKDGAKSLLKWTGATNGTDTTTTRMIGPSWRRSNDTVDTVTVKEKKEVAGITLKGEQKAEIDYNHNYDYFQYINTNMSSPDQTNQLRTQESYPDAKLFSSGVMAEKWMLNDKTFAALGYHYNHIHATDLMRLQQFQSTGGLYNFGGSDTYALADHQSLWSYANNIEDEHVWVGNFFTDLTPDLVFISSARYEYMGRHGISDYLDVSTAAGTPDTTSDNTITASVKDQDNLEGEHLALRYYGISHTSLYAQVDMQQDREWFTQSSVNSVTVANDFSQERVKRTQTESWTLGGRIVPNKYFDIKTQVGEHWEDREFDFVKGFQEDYFLDALKMNGEEASSTVTWKPYRWLSNSLRYQFLDNRYFPRDVADTSGIGRFNAAKNRMLSSIYSYDISLQPMDPLLFTVSYSHAENYIKSAAGASPTVRIPTFNSGDNSWLFSSTYFPKENLSWTNTVMYTLSDNYVDFGTGLPLGSSFKELTLSTGIQWTIHKWLTVGPTYEYASYHDNPLVGAGNYSAHIFMLDAKFKW